MTAALGARRRREGIRGPDSSPGGGGCCGWWKEGRFGERGFRFSNGDELSASKSGANPWDDFSGLSRG